MEWLQPLLEWIRLHPGWAGSFLFLIALTESLAAVGLFVPGAMLMFGAGTLIATGHLAFWPSVAWAAAGAIIGDGVSFWLGRRLGPRLRGVWPFRSHPRTLARSETFFQDHGGKSVLLGRFVGPVRPIIPAVAGMLGMAPGRFLLVNVGSALLWAPAYLLPGAVFAASLSLAAAVAGRLLALLALAALLGWVGWSVVSALHSGLRRTALASYLAHRRVLWLGLAGLMLVVPVVVSAIYVWQLRLPPVPQVVSGAAWRSELWQTLPAYRQPLVEPEQAFQLQIAGTAAELPRLLAAAGWRPAPEFDLRSALRWLSPQPDPLTLPPLPRWHRARAPELVLFRSLDPNRRAVLRLWRSPLLLSGEQPVWLGTLAEERLESGWPLVEQQTLAGGLRLLRDPPGLAMEQRDRLRLYWPQGGLDQEEAAAFGAPCCSSAASRSRGSSSSSNCCFSNRLSGRTSANRQLTQ